MCFPIGFILHVSDATAVFSLLRGIACPMDTLMKNPETVLASGFFQCDPFLLPDMGREMGYDHKYCKFKKR